MGYYRDILRLGIAGILDGWALQGYFAIGQMGRFVKLNIAGIFIGWAL